MVESEETQVQEKELEANQPLLDAEAPESIQHKNGRDPAEMSEMENDVNIQPETGYSKETARSQSESGSSDKEKASSNKINDIKTELENTTTPEEKLQKTIELMEASLAQSGNPDFKTFWESRKECLDLFKVNIPPALKALHWGKYRELTREAKRLKEIFEEQTAFAVEQIDIAIQALEKDIREFNSQLETVSPPDLPKGIRTLKEHYPVYLEKQRELNLLNAQAARINALRKELIRTEMRIRQKNLFFQRLSSAGDHVFPNRKELIKEISQMFVDDINDFVNSRFSNLSNEKSLHHLREEIKALQAAAKIMTLNTHAFTQTRLMLSTCWDKLKVLEKERKKEQTQQKQTFKENADVVKTKIDAFSEEISTNQISTSEAQKKYDEINKFMRSQELGRDDVKGLKDHLNQAYKTVKSRLIEEEKRRREVELEKEQEKQNKIKEIEERLSRLASILNEDETEGVANEIDELVREIQLLSLSEYEQDALMRELIPIKDALVEKEELEVLETSGDKAQKLSRVEKVLDRALNRREEIKEQIEKYRKASGSSGLDFEQSMYFSEQLNTEKSRLEKVNSSIAKLESAVAQLKG